TRRRCGPFPSVPGRNRAADSRRRPQVPYWCFQRRSRAASGAVSGAFQAGVNLPCTDGDLQRLAVSHVARYDAHKGPASWTHEQRSIVREVHRVAFDRPLVAGDAHLAAEGARELAPAVGHRGEPLGLVQAEPLLEVLEQTRAYEWPWLPFSALEEQAGCDGPQLLGKVVHLQGHVEAHPENGMADAVGLGAQLGEQASDLAASAFDVVRPLDPRALGSKLARRFRDGDRRRERDLRGARGADR